MQPCSKSLGVEDNIEIVCELNHCKIATSAIFETSIIELKYNIKDWFKDNNIQYNFLYDELLEGLWAERLSDKALYFQFKPKIRFNILSDAILFKLTWCGCV